jgi:hypothetical protein
VLALGLVIAVVWVFVTSLKEKRATSPLEAVQDEADGEAAPADWLPVAPVQIDGENEAFQYDAPISPAIAAALIAANGLTEPLSFRRVSEVGITRAMWNEIRRDLVPTFAEYDKSGSIILNLAGCELIKKIAPPLTHSPASIPNLGNSAGETQHNTAQHTPTQAGGVGDK